MSTLIGPQSSSDFFSLILWQLVLIYTIPVGYWLYELLLYSIKSRYTTPPGFTWNLNNVQVRVLTIDSEDVVQKTVDSIPNSVHSIRVITESPLDITGENCEVLVVPDDFECNAQAKGRAIEWARQTHPTDREYILYLDEDTIIPDLDGIPDADIVQFRERPVHTGSFLAYLAEVHRIGFNVEQLAFPYLRVPLYAWGGGIAIRTSLENEVTWDVDTMVEDSVFAWRALLNHDASYYLSDVFFNNQAPPSVWSMINQRRRWLTGTRMKSDLLPTDYRYLYQMRDIGWSISVFAPVIWFLSLLNDVGLSPYSLQQVLLPQVYLPLAFTLLGFVYLWSIIGLYYYHASIRTIIALLLLTPFVVLIHSLGSLYGLLIPAQRFAVTTKVSDAPKPNP